MAGGAPISPTGQHTAEDADRARAFLRACDAACAEYTRSSRFGTAFFNDNFPKLYVLNFLRADVPDGAAEEIARDAEVVHARARRAHRRIAVYEEWGAKLVPQLDRLGWDTECDLVMVYRDGPPAARLSAPVDEIDTNALRRVRERYIRTLPHGKDEDVVRQLLDKDVLFSNAVNARHLGVVADDEVVCACDVYSDGRTAQIEDVVTLEAHRGRGYASAVVLTAAADAIEAGHDFVFLVADDAETSKHLYRKLGFEVAGRIYDFWKPA